MYILALVKRYNIYIYKMAIVIFIECILLRILQIIL
jgi:hypothetical protein